MHISQQIALVTGGASGLGEAVVRRLAAQGAQVISVDLNEERGLLLPRLVSGQLDVGDVEIRELNA